MKKIYKIYSPNDLNSYYIGKCGGYLSMRLCQHKYYYKRAVESNCCSGTFYTSYWIIQKGDAKIECIEEIEDDKLAREREDYWIGEYKRLGYEVVNINKASGKCKEKQRAQSIKHYWKKRDVCLERCKNYYYNNLDKCREYQRKRYYLKKYGNLDGFVPKDYTESCLSNTDVVE